MSSSKKLTPSADFYRWYERTLFQILKYQGVRIEWITKMDAEKTFRNILGRSFNKSRFESAWKLMYSTSHLIIRAIRRNAKRNNYRRKLWKNARVKPRRKLP